MGPGLALLTSVFTYRGPGQPAPRLIWTPSLAQLASAVSSTLAH
jgi:hypothetical protein